MAAADPANPATSSTVRLTCGPNSNVTGVARLPGSSSEVFHIRFTPCGAFMAVLCRTGSRKCSMAVAV
jgi:hypothetical protein